MQKNAWRSLAVVASVVALTACESSWRFTVVNRCDAAITVSDASNNVYRVTAPAHSQKSTNVMGSPYPRTIRVVGGVLQGKTLPMIDQRVVFKGDACRQVTAT